MIRREDKTVVNKLTILGAFLAAGAAAFFLWKYIDTQKSRLSAERANLDRYSAIDNIDISVLGGSKMDLSEAMASQLNSQIQQTHSAIGQMEGGFLTSLPAWGVSALCIGAAGIAAMAAYIVLWPSLLTASAILYMFIRMMYRIVRIAAPQSQLAQGCTAIDDQSGQFIRNPHRLLPDVIKVIILLFLGLLLLMVVVWQWTSGSSILSSV